MSVERARGVWCCGCNHWWLLGAIALLVACSGLAIILVLKFYTGGTLENVRVFLLHLSYCYTAVLFSYLY